jgi:hypothetical protein
MPEQNNRYYLHYLSVLYTINYITSTTFLDLLIKLDNQVIIMLVLATKVLCCYDNINERHY